MAAEGENEPQALRAQLAELKAEHQRLDLEIAALEAGVAADRLALQRMKKQKLLLRDRIVLIEDQIYPDIIA
ncbi:MAG: YdcH family protein [Pikeienuella sp.]